MRNINYIYIIVLLPLFIYGCDPSYYLRVDNCYVNKIKTENATIFVTFIQTVASYHIVVPFDDLDETLKMQRENIKFFINGEESNEFNFVIFSQHKIKDGLIIIQDRYAELVFAFNESSEKFEVKVVIEDLKYCNEEGICEKEDFSYAFAYDAGVEIKRVIMAGGSTWWRNPGVDVCVR